MLYNIHELSGMNKCQMRRSRKIHLEKTAIDNTGGRMKLARNIIRMLYNKEITAQAALKAIDDYFEQDTDYAAKKTRAIYAQEMKQCLSRYFNSERRKPIIPKELVVPIFKDMEVKVDPDLLFVNNTMLEVVALQYSKPVLKINARKEEFSPYKSLQLYAMICYGRLVAKQMNFPKTATIRASIYYLRKSNDSDKNNIFDPDFFDTAGGNVVSIDDRHVFDGSPNDIDKLFLPQIEDFLKGDDNNCTEEKCQKCEFYKLCSFKLPPSVIDREKKVKSITTLNLTKEQKAAIDFTKGIARINAGAGAGKTLTIALRTVALLNKGYKPEEIVLLTFTNTGAEEMRERINVYNKEFGNGCDLSEMRIQTFNAFQDAIVHKEWERLGFAQEPHLIDDVERSSIIVDILKDKDIKGIDFRNFYMNTKDVQGALTIARKVFNIMKVYNLGDAEGDAAEIVRHLGAAGRMLPISAIEQLALLYDEYTQQLNDQSLIEFADQELLVFQLLYMQPDYFAGMGIKHVIVDEFQDSNQGQMDFIRMIIDTPSFESLMVVGDDSQAIFGFRDTSPKYIIDFYDMIKRNGTDFYLLENHRSTPEIIDFANKLNDKNTCRVIKSLIATRPHGKKPVARGFYSQEQEYGYIVEGIKTKLNQGIKPEDIAFIASKKTELIKMAHLLSEAGIPSVLLNPEPLISNSRVLAAIDMVRFIDNPNATEFCLNWLNCLSKNQILKCTDQQISKMIEKSKMEVIEMRKLPYKQCLEVFFTMLENLDDNDEVYQSFVETLRRKKSMFAIIQYCKNFLLYGADCAVKRQHDYPGVVLTTAHSSKGLEWPVVFNSISDYDSPEIRRKIQLLEEKRRLFFVSSTRARDELYITGVYTAFGQKEDKAYNIFLTEAYEILGQSFQPDQNNISAANAVKAS